MTVNKRAQKERQRNMTLRKRLLQVIAAGIIISAILIFSPSCLAAITSQAAGSSFYVSCEEYDEYAAVGDTVTFTVAIRNSDGDIVSNSNGRYSCAWSYGQDETEAASFGTSACTVSIEITDSSMISCYYYCKVTDNLTKTTDTVFFYLGNKSTYFYINQSGAVYYESGESVTLTPDIRGWNNEAADASLMTFVYKWYQFDSETEDYVELSETSSSLTLANVTANASYKCDVYLSSDTEYCDCQVFDLIDKSTFEYTVDDADGRCVMEGDSTDQVLTITDYQGMEVDTSEYTFQWYKKNSDGTYTKIDGETSDTLHIESVSASDYGTEGYYDESGSWQDGSIYWIRVYNADGRQVASVMAPLKKHVLYDYFDGACASFEEDGFRRCGSCLYCGKYLAWNAETEHYDIAISEEAAVIPSVEQPEIAGTSYVYTGEAIEPEITVTDREGHALVDGTDYTVSYTDNIEAGEAVATVTLCGNYEGTALLSYEIVIAIPNLTCEDKKVSYSASKSYKLTDLIPEFDPETETLAGSYKSYTGTTTELAQDFTAKKAGYYKLTVSAKPGYVFEDGTTSQKMTLTITRIAPTIKISTAKKTVKYSKIKKKSVYTTAVSVSGVKESAKKYYYKVSGSKKLTIAKTTGKIKVLKKTKKGTYKIKVKVVTAATTDYTSAKKYAYIKVVVK